MSQTVTEEKGKIVYENKVEVPNTSRADLYGRVKEALVSLEKYAAPSVSMDDPEQGKLEAEGRIRIPNKQKDKYAVGYHLHLHIKDNQYTYRIDSLDLLHLKRHKTKAKAAEELFGDINNSDKVAVETEKQLNEMDMSLLKFIDLLNNHIQNRTARLASASDH